jgi:Lysozyme like domain
MPMSGPALGAMAIGSIFLYSAIKGKSVLASAQSIIMGGSPGAVKPTLQITDSSATANSTSSSGKVPGVQTSGLPSAGTYSHSQLMKLWESVGGDASKANNAACHAIQESGGRPLVTSSNPDGGTNVGLWQLDTKGKGAGYSIQALQNAENNARITVFATRNGTDWSAWATPGC